MDWVGWYTIFLSVCAVIIACTAKDVIQVRAQIIGLLFSLPIYGRIFGWW